MDQNKNGNGFRPIDIATLAYITIQTILVILFMSSKPGWYFFLLFYFASAGIAILLAVYPLSGSSVLWRALRITYPLFLFTFFYEAVGPQVFMIVGTPMDSHIVALERAVFGVDPAFALQSRMEIWLNEVMSFGYISYYFLLPFGAILLFLKRRWVGLERLILSCAIAFYLSYLIFIAYPVTGPRFYLSHFYYLPLIGPFLTPLAHHVVEFGGLFGGAMPSSHCAVALAVVWVVCGEFRKIKFVLVPILLLLCVSTVYGRYHYTSDVVVGLIIGSLALMAAHAWMLRSRLYRIRVGEGRAALDPAVLETVDD